MIFLRSLMFNLLFYGITTVMAVVGLPLLLLPGRAIMAYASLWAQVLRLMLLIVGIRHRITGPIPQGQVIYAAKHQSAWETIILYHELGHPAPVLKKELVFLPLIGLYFLRVASVPINRAAAGKALRMLMDSARRIAGLGHSILIFPQGTRVSPGQDHPYHPGTFALYQATGLAVVPVALNSGLFWPRSSFVKRPGMIDVSLGEPIPPGLGRKAFMALLEERIENATAALPGMAVDRKTG
ncbi:MAG: lysophospholipid acyltransferase family protein [Candidatus Puniceispirillales bacterium]